MGSASGRFLRDGTTRSLIENESSLRKGLNAAHSPGDVNANATGKECLSSEDRKTAAEGADRRSDLDPQARD